MGIYIDHDRNTHAPNNISTTKIFTVSNILDADEAVRRLVAEGYSKDFLYVLAHNHDRAEHVAEYTETNTLGVVEEGAINAIANLFRSRADELRIKLRAMGISKTYADRMESDMDEGKIVILAWNQLKGEAYSPLFDYYPFKDY